ncbi:hypothetical protein BT69DRAFT_1280317 [Atractiella rhizophila]|nr:hypothetical protein BT69DRAFT_1280317 [Atractiella rhizophila]
MALYNWIVFCLLVFEMSLFVALILPIPFTWRRAMFKFVSESPTVPSRTDRADAYRFVGVLFVDALQQMMKIHAQGTRNRTEGIKLDLGAENEWRSKKERNMYLNGFTLFLSLILSRTYSLILDLIKTQEDLARLQRQVGTGGKDSEEVEKLKGQLRELQKDYDSLAGTGPAAAKGGKKTD